MSLEDYEILKIIGRGSYGEVHLALHKKDKKQYVVKKMFIRSSPKDKKAAELEARLLKNLKHPNIVSYKDSFEGKAGELCIVMGFAEGGDLYARLRENKANSEYLSEQQAVRWFIQICMALQYLHERMILHRDLKTQNIFLTKTNIIKVGDLGIAKKLESSDDMATTLIGTPYYMSPEVFRGQPYNSKSDVWALGCVLYEMLTYKHAFNAKDISLLRGKILKAQLPEMPEAYPKALSDLIKALLSPNPDERPRVVKILRNPFIKKHIQLFLDESNKKRRPASERSSRKSSVASSSSASRPTSSRKTSANSPANSPSPRPPSLAPDPAKPARPPRARSPNVISPPPEPPSAKGIHQISSHVENMKEISKRTENVDIRENGDAHQSDFVAPEQRKTSNTSKSSVADGRSSQERPKSTPANVLGILNENTNNSKHDSGVFVNFSDAPQPQKVKIHKAQEVKSSSKLKSDRFDKDELFSQPKLPSPRSSPSEAQKSGRPLPECPKITVEPKRKEVPASERNNLGDSGESVVSVASSVASTMSARERRRQRQLKEMAKKPSIVEEIRKSRSTGFKHRISSRKTEESREESKKVEPPPERENDDAARALSSSDGAVPQSKRNVAAPVEPQHGQPEVEEFMTMLQSTLQLDVAKTGDGDSPVMEEESGPRKGDLSPVLESTETSSSTSMVQSRPFARNTPAATPVSEVNPPKIMEFPRVEHLNSTEKIMDKILVLRKDCIQGLGVSSLHRAYEILDETDDAVAITEKLLELLGRRRFEKWYEKIWQLKTYEESLFGHCGTITAF